MKSNLSVDHLEYFLHSDELNTKKRNRSCKLRHFLPDDGGPQQAIFPNVIHVRIRIELLHMEHARSLPDLLYHQDGARERAHAGCVTDGLGLDLLVAFCMVESEYVKFLI